MGDGYESAQKQRNWLERLGARIPGFKGYQDRELRRDVDRMQRELGQQPRTTVIPLRMYLYNGLAKVEIALARGRRSWDRRQEIAKRDANRAIQRWMRQEQR